MKPSNSTTQNDHGRIACSSARVESLFSSNSSEPDKSRDRNSKPYIVGLPKWDTAFTLLTTFLILLLLYFNTADACEDHTEVHGFLRIGAGAMQPLGIGDDDFLRGQGYGDLSANIQLGIRFPLTRNHLLDARIGHDSFWFRGDPFNDDDEFYLNTLTVGYEYRWF